MPQTTRPRRSSEVGFTLIEAMLVVGILTVLAFLAAPSALGMLRRAELAGEAREFYTALNEAKARAKGAARVHCVEVDRAARTWQITEDADEDGTCGPGDTVIARHSVRGSTIAFGPNDGYPAAFPGPYSLVPRSTWCACTGVACAATCVSDDAVIAFNADGAIDAVSSMSLSLHDPTNVSTVYGVALIGPSGAIKLASAEAAP